MIDTTPETPLIVAYLGAWREWLMANDHSSDGVWVLLAKKGVTTPPAIDLVTAQRRHHREPRVRQATA